MNAGDVFIISVDIDKEETRDREKEAQKLVDELFE
ncbi:Protein of unknown function (DUF3006) [Brevibacillus sp. BC25]|nr:Protein of unknown function (DUF3006) [Brevibacillus sp. BC25]